MGLLSVERGVGLLGKGDGGHGDGGKETET